MYTCVVTTSGTPEFISIRNKADTETKEGRSLPQKSKQKPAHEKGA